MITETIRKETGTLPYMMFPKFLMDIRISETAKLLYMVLLDRSRLSAGNARWIDQDGNVYLSDEDRRMLQEEVGKWEDYVERISSYMASTGKQYQDHAATIIHWAERDGAMKKTKKCLYLKRRSGPFYILS